MKRAGRPSQVLVDKIRVDVELQVRVRIDAETVAAYAERMQAGDRFPAIVVFHDGHDYWLADGFHRWHAAQRIGRRAVSAQVIKGKREDAAWYAVGANRTNGLRMTNSDKERAVKLALKLHPKDSDRKIALHIGVSHTYVAKYRTEANPTGNRCQLDSRVGADGKARKLPTRATDDDPPPSTQDDPPPEVADDDPPPEPDDPPPTDVDDLPPAADSDEPPECAPSDDDEMPVSDAAAGEDIPPETPPGPEFGVDRLDRPVPNERIADAFTRDHELVELCTTLSRVKGAVLEAIGRNDPLVADIAQAGFEADINNTRRWIDSARPYAVCPYCGGDGCKACRRRGWVNKLTWDATPPENRT